MKKSIAIILATAIFAMFFASCKNHELCPAYGKGQVKVKTETRV